MNHTENTASVVKEARLLIHCLAMDVILLCAFASAVMCLLRRCLAIGIYVIIPITIFTYLVFLLPNFISTKLLYNFVLLKSDYFLKHFVSKHNFILIP
jgi:hypothetical protein